MFLYFSRYIENTTDRIACDQQFFVGRDDEYLDTAFFCIDFSFFASNLFNVELFVDFDAKPFEIGADALSDHCGIFTYTSCENDGVSSIQFCQIGTKVFLRTLRKDVDAEMILLNKC